MSDSKPHKLQELIDSLQSREDERINCLNDWMRGPPTIEDRVYLANSRAADAAGAISFLVKYIMDREKEAALNESKEQS